MPEGVRSPHPMEIVWEGEKRFRGGIPGGPTLVIDGDRKVAPSPVDTMIVSLAACSAIDVVEILQKRRTPASSLKVHVEFSRAPTAPRRLTEVAIRFIVATSCDRPNVERAVDLAAGKYCSVSASLAPDIDLTWSVELLPFAEEEAG